MTLRSRVVLIVTVLVVSGITAASLLAYGSASSELVRETDSFLEQRADELDDGTRKKPDKNESDRDDQNGDDQNGDDQNGDDQNGDDQNGTDGSSDLAFDPDVIAQTLDATGAVTASSGGALPVGDVDVEVAAGGRQKFSDITIDGDDYRMLTVPADEGGAVQIATTTAGDVDVLARLRWRLLAVGLALATIAALLGWLLMRRTTKPLEELAAATERVATTADLTPLALDRHDEVGRLADSFDQMLTALALSREQQRRLVQDAAHELRTPLTSLRTNIELLQRAPNLPPDEHAALMDGLSTEISELNDLFGELIQLATDATDAGGPDVVVDVADVVEDAVERFRIRTGRTVDVHVEPTEVTGNPGSIDRAVTNLLSNADKFSPIGEPIDIELSDGRLTVRDRGPGIPAAERDQVFDRFFRSRSARSTPGSGLGLAIVRQVAEQHGGTAFAHARDGGGAEVGFSLPVASAASSDGRR